jgi:hypothetical protein
MENQRPRTRKDRAVCRLSAQFYDRTGFINESIFVLSINWKLVTVISIVNLREMILFVLALFFSLLNYPVITLGYHKFRIL